MSNESFQLYAKPSFLEGIARLVDIWGDLNQYNVSESGKEADYRALLSDWEKVGEDIYKAIELFEDRYKKELHA